MTSPLPEAHARLEAARAARELSDLARAFVGETGTPLSAAERIRAARRLRALVHGLVDRVVLAEALGGEEWAELAAALGRDEESVRGEYGPAVGEWQREAVAPAESAAGDAEALDGWYRRHREDTDPSADQPVSGLLADC